MKKVGYILRKIGDCYLVSYVKILYIMVLLFLFIPGFIFLMMLIDLDMYFLFSTIMKCRDMSVEVVGVTKGLIPDFIRVVN